MLNVHLHREVVTEHALHLLTRCSLLTPIKMKFLLKVDKTSGYMCMHMVTTFHLSNFLMCDCLITFLTTLVQCYWDFYALWIVVQILFRCEVGLSCCLERLATVSLSGPSVWVSIFCQFVQTVKSVCLDCANVCMFCFTMYIICLNHLFRCFSIMSKCLDCVADYFDCMSRCVGSPFDYLNRVGVYTNILAM